MNEQECAKGTDNQRVPIIVYHHVYPDDSLDLKQATFETGSGIIGADDFRKQLQHIVDQGWTTVPTARIINWISREDELPPKSLAVHFDNGWLDTLTVALPIMEEFGLKGMCFPITDGMDAASEARPPLTVRTQTEGVITKPFMTWEGVGQLLDAGWEIGAHSATHCKMGQTQETDGDQAILREVACSNEAFKKHIGFIPKHFAYPSGSRNDRTDELLMAHYQSLRLWHCEYPIAWSFTDRNTAVSAIDIQNVDLRVPLKDFERITREAMLDE